MIYAVGPRASWNHYLSECTDPKIAGGARVFRTHQDAGNYVFSNERCQARGIFTVFGVKADWEVDVQHDTDPFEGYFLKSSATLVKLGH